MKETTRETTSVNYAVVKMFDGKTGKAVARVVAAFRHKGDAERWTDYKNRSAAMGRWPEFYKIAECPITIVPAESFSLEPFRQIWQKERNQILSDRAFKYRGITGGTNHEGLIPQADSAPENDDRIIECAYGFEDAMKDENEKNKREESGMLY